MSEAEWIKCPTCGWQWKKEHKGLHAIEHGKVKEAKGEFTFEKGDLNTDAFISVRNLPGGRGNPASFSELSRITLAEAKENPEYQKLIQSLKQKIQNILKILS